MTANVTLTLIFRLNDFILIPQNVFRNAKNMWGNSLKEYYCVDTSSTMSDLAKLLLQEGNPNNENILPKGLFYRQFLPASPNV